MSNIILNVNRSRARTVSLMRSATSLAVSRNVARRVTLQQPGPRGLPGVPGIDGAGYLASSATSLTVGTGTRVFTTQGGLAYSTGARVRATSAANPGDWMEGQVTSYVGTLLTVNVILTSGTSNTRSDWTLNVAGEQGGKGDKGDSAVTSVTRQSYSEAATTLTPGQTVFTVTGGYAVGNLDVFRNGVRLAATDFTATNGTTFTLGVAADTGDVIECMNFGFLGVVAISGALIAANNLSDVASVPTARGNLGLGDSATKNVGTTAGTVMAGDDSRVPGAMQKSSNLSDVQSVVTSRANLLGAGGAQWAVLRKKTAADGDVVWASVADPTANLIDWMDITYPGGWSYRGTTDTGSDAGVAINAALTALIARYYKGGTIFVPPSGVFQIKTDLNPNLLSGNRILGASSVASFLCFGTGTTRGFWFNGYNGRTGGGLERLGYFIEDNAGDSLKNSLLLQGDAVFQPDSITLHDVRASSFGSTAYWLNGLFINGMSRDPSLPSPPGGSLQGVRVGTIKNFQQFNCRNAGALFLNADCWTVENLGIWTQKPGTAGGTVYIGGNSTWGSNSIELDMRLVVCTEINLTNATYCRIAGKTGQVTAGASFDRYDLAIITGGTGLVGALGPNGRSFII